MKARSLGPNDVACVTDSSFGPIRIIHIVIPGLLDTPWEPTIRAILTDQTKASTHLFSGHMCLPSCHYSSEVTFNEERGSEMLDISEDRGLFFPRVIHQKAKASEQRDSSPNMIADLPLNTFPILRYSIYTSCTALMIYFPSLR